MKYLLHAATALLLIGFSTSASAQAYKFTKKKHYISVGAGLNSMHYFGDLAPINRETLDISTDIGFSRANFSAFAQYRFLPRMTARAMLTTGLLAADDRNARENNSDGDNYRYYRNLHFRANVTELAAMVVIDLFDNQGVYYRRPKIPIPYITVGIALLHFNPQAREIQPIAGMPEDEAWLYGVPGDKWVNLRQFQTEGIDYSPFTYAIPIGIGVRYKLTNHIDIAAELTARYTGTDYLDDVSRDYIDYSGHSFEAIGYAYRGHSYELSNSEFRDPDGTLPYKIVDAGSYKISNSATPGEKRGSSDNDIFATFGIHASYIFGGSIRSPKFR